MSVLTRVACRLGKHSGEWSPPDDRCESGRVCDSCGKIETKEQHTWDAFDYLAADRCDQRRRCLRCGSTQSRVHHQWTGWRYRDEQQHSAQVRTCTRCGEEESTRYTLRQRGA
jgi:hypothetical protein